jgi:hypothetical protein
MRPPVRPTSVTVFAVLQIIFGALGVCGGIAGLAAKPMLESIAKNQPKGVANPLEMEEEIEKRLPGYKTVQMTQLGIGLPLAVMAIVGAAMMLKGNATGHKMTVIYGVVTLLVGVFGLVYSFGFVMPAMNEYFDAQSTKGSAGAAQATGAKIGAMVGSCAGVLFGLVYPGLLVYFMTRPRVKDYFAGRLPPEGFDDRDRDLDRRRDDEDRFRDRPPRDDDRYQDRPPQDDDRYRDRPGDDPLRGYDDRYR